MTGAAVTPERAGEMPFSEPYLDETLAFVVKDQLREEFSSWASIRDLGAFPVGVPDLPYYIDRVKTRAPALKLQVVDTTKQIEDGLKEGRFDAVVFPAERGSVLTLLYPKYTVVVPEPGIVKIPLAYPVARRDQDWASFPQHVDRAQTARRHHRRTLRPLDSGEASRKAPAALVGDP